MNEWMHDLMNECSLNCEFWLNEWMVVPMYEWRNEGNQGTRHYCLFCTEHRSCVS